MSTTRVNVESAAPPTSGGIRVQFLWEAVRRHPIVFLLLLIAAGSAAWAVWTYLPLPKLTGVTVFHIAPQPPAVLNPTAESRIDFHAYKTTQESLIKQRIVLSQALNQPTAKDLAIARSPDPVARLDRVLQVDFRGGPEYMRLSVEGDDEAELRGVLKAVSAAYLAQVDRNDNGAKTRRRKELEALRDRYEATFKSHQKTLTELATILQASSPAGLALMEDLARSRLERIKVDLLRTEKDFEDADRDAKTYREKAEKVKDLTVSEADVDRALLADPGLLARERTALERQRAFEELDKQVRDKKLPRLVEARTEWEAAKADLEKYAKVLRPTLAAELRKKLVEGQVHLAESSATRADALRKSKERLETSVDAILREVGNKSVIYLDLEKVRNDIARTEKSYQIIVLELDQYELERTADLRVTVAEEPYIVSGIEGNRRMKTALMAAGGVLLVGLTGLVFWEIRNRRVLAIDDVGKGLGLTVFGTLPRAAVLDHDPRGYHGAVTEAMDTARTMLLYRPTSGHVTKSILVTSALPGEGKTSLSGHLAISLTRAGYRTLLIDADMRKPSSHVLFNLPAGPGLSELLRGEATLAEAVCATPFPGLAVLQAGRWDMAATQALAGELWSDLRRAVEHAYDYVVIDSAPLLPVVDSLLLARNVGGVVLAVMHDHSRVARVAEAQHRLLSVGAELLGVVVNGTEPSGGAYGYGKYGGYGAYAKALVPASPPPALP